MTDSALAQTDIGRLSMAKIAGWIACFALLVIAPLYVSTLHNALSHLELARAAKGAGKNEEAIDHYRRAISWSSPLNPAAYAAVVELLDWADMLPDPNMKLSILWEVKRGLMSSRSFMAPRVHDSGSHMLRVEAKIRQLSGDKAYEERLRELSPPRTNYTFQILAQFMFWAWILSAIRLIFLCVAPEGRIIMTKFRRQLPLSLAFFALWLICLSLA